eukprot:TRINITY_DN7938_c0_g1_i1.p1 TRINITY_DN7938_c0_g1~~TRINITY_DN7938_c0_g1_i1.p1  ORF type:complete len:67 (-),score=5.79 TRINITY_DN7938_c0_g1_i1:49-249(-)
MSWKLRDWIFCTVNSKEAIVIMVTQRKKGKLSDFEGNNGTLYDLRFADGSIMRNVEEKIFKRARNS